MGRKKTNHLDRIIVHQKKKTGKEECARSICNDYMQMQCTEEICIYRCWEKPRPDGTCMENGETIGRIQKRTDDRQYVLATAVGVDE